MLKYLTANDTILQTLHTTLLIMIWITSQLIGIGSCRHQDVISKCCSDAGNKRRLTGRQHRTRTGEVGDREGGDWRQLAGEQQGVACIIHWCIVGFIAHNGTGQVTLLPWLILIWTAICIYFSCLYFSLSLHTFWTLNHSYDFIYFLFSLI